MATSPCVCRTPPSIACSPASAQWPHCGDVAVIASSGRHSRLMTLRTAFLACLLGLSFIGGIAAHANGEKKGMLKQDYVPPIFANGPSLSDRGFDAWLKAHAGPVK